jgi:hypothetical protein
VAPPADDLRRHRFEEKVESNRVREGGGGTNGTNDDGANDGGFEARYLNWSACFGEKKAKSIQRLLAASKCNGLHAEVCVRVFVCHICVCKRCRDVVYERDKDTS